MLGGLLLNKQSDCLDVPSLVRWVVKACGSIKGAEPQDIRKKKSRNTGTTILRDNDIEIVGVV